ncbi:MAG: type III-A CRISPR-associated RAMP protein Csm5 [Euryarchaeota archaeon]
MKGGLETVELRLEVLTPLHVGVSREEEFVRGLDYYVRDREARVVDPMTLDPERAREAAEALREGDYKRAEGAIEGAEVLYRVELRTGEPPDRYLPTYRPTRDDDPWVPGTSVKGVIRTGLLLAALRRLHELGIGLGTLTDRLPGGNRAYGALDRRLRVTVFQGGTAPRSGYGWPNVHPHADVLRAVRVSDARPVRVRTAVLRAELHPEGRYLDAREFVVDGAFELELGVDRAELESVLKTWSDVGMPRLPRPVFEFLNEARGELREFWEETLEGPEALLERAREGWEEGLRALRESFNLDVPRDADAQLGWGGGRLTKTVVPLLGRVLPSGRLGGLRPRTVRLVDGEIPGLVRMEPA